jgi:hypothetical protein
MEDSDHFKEGRDIVRLLGVGQAEATEIEAHAQAWANITGNQAVIMMGLANILAMLVKLAGDTELHQPFDPTLN